MKGFSLPNTELDAIEARRARDRALDIIEGAFFGTVVVSDEALAAAQEVLRHASDIDASYRHNHPDGTEWD